MPTVQEICDYADRKYPNSETAANKVSDLNDIHSEVFVKIARLKNEYEIYETSTVADQLTYSLPSNCTIDNIIAVKVSKTTTISSSTEWNDYEYAGLNLETTIGRYYGYSPDQKIALLNDDLPISTTGLSIRIFYYKKPSALSSSNMSAVPELHEDYHNLLKYGLIQALASQGHNPDTEIADYWQKKYDEFMDAVVKNLSDRGSKMSTNSAQAQEWW
jgi:hypothetical protein